MVLRIFEMIATCGFLTALECTKFVFCRGSAPDTDGGGAYSAIQDSLAGLRGLLLKGGERRERGKGKGRDQPPYASSWIRRP